MLAVWKPTHTLFGHIHREIKSKVDVVGSDMFLDWQVPIIIRVLGWRSFGKGGRQGYICKLDFSVIIDNFWHCELNDWPL
jgi:hypothetical protein